MAEVNERQLILPILSWGSACLSIGCAPAALIAVGLGVIALYRNRKHRSFLAASLSIFGIAIGLSMLLVYAILTYLVTTGRAPNWLNVTSL